MYQLVLLTGPPPPKGFIVPADVSEDLHKRGTTYGSRILRPGGYSDSLKHLILQCLCESPGQRPDLFDLHRRIRQGQETCQNVAASAVDNAAKDDEPVYHSAGAMDFWFTPRPPPIFIDLTAEETPANSPSLSALVTQFEQALQDIENGKAGDMARWEKDIEAYLHLAEDPYMSSEEMESLKERMVEIVKGAHIPPILRNQRVSRGVSALVTEIAQQAAQGAGVHSSHTQREPANERRQVETDEPSQHTPLSKLRVKRERSTDDDDLGININAGKRRRIRSPDIMILNDAGKWEAVRGASQDGNKGGQNAEDVAKDQDAGAVEAGNNNEDKAENVNRDEIEDDLPDYVSEEETNG